MMLSVITKFLNKLFLTFRTVTFFSIPTSIFIALPWLHVINKTYLTINVIQRDSETPDLLIHANNCEQKVCVFSSFCYRRKFTLAF